MTKRNRYIILHIIASVAFLSIPIITSPDFNTDRNLFTIKPFLQSFSRFFLLLAYFYLNFYYLLPNYFFQKKKLIFGIVTLILFVIVFKLPDVLFPFNIENLPRMEFPNQFSKGSPKPPFPFLEGSIFQFLFVFGLSYLIKINNRFEEINNEKQIAEISYLKAQINPHFLFNTLNSLYALTLQKSNEAPNAVLKLSGIMRYVVSESDSEFVTLDKELNYIKDYIELQKLRLDKSIFLSFEINGETKGKAIVPLILIPFIENAFKYGINPDTESHIKIQIFIKDQTLTLVVQNSIVANNISEEEKTEEGLKNTQKRLEFMYPGKHSLTVNENDDTYEVTLKIELT